MLLASHPVVAENWVKVSQSEDGKRITSIDLDSIKVTDGLVRHWDKLEEYSSSDTQTGKTIFGNATDCKSETQATTSMHSYESGKIVFSYTAPPDTKLEFRAYPPGTTGASGIWFICRIYNNGWLPFPQLEGDAQWEKVPGYGSYFVDKKPIELVGGLIRYQIKTMLKPGKGHVRFGIASNCTDSSSAITESLKFDASEKFEPEFSFNLEVERPPLKFQRAEAETESSLKYACDYVQAQARVTSGSRKAR